MLPRHATAGWPWLLALLLSVLLNGCAPSTNGRWSGPQSPALLRTRKWAFHGIAGQQVTTPHYRIYSTLDQADCRERLAQLMEGALLQYRRMAPAVAPTERPMQCYVFARRSQWEDFTREHTGNDAPIYLQVNRGGYTVDDWFVTYYVGDIGTYRIAAHEGWHQFVARHFAARMPPFLEEGLACMFEHVEWEDDLPRWNLSSNPHRARALARAVEHRQLWPLKDLVAMHAGDVVNQPVARIEAFYAQSWAFARFLWDAEQGRYRPALLRLLADTSAGAVGDPIGNRGPIGQDWHPEAVRPLLARYLGMDLQAIDRAYQAYIAQIVSRQGRPQPQW